MEYEQRPQHVTTWRRVAGVSAVAVAVLALSALLSAAEDWFALDTDPSLTGSAIVVDFLGILALYLVVAVPVGLVLWNHLLTCVLPVPRLRYWEVLVVMAVASWLGV